ncbi:MAG: DUF177 domain-containing protein [Pseudomonadota bacterium]
MRVRIRSIPVNGGLDVNFQIVPSVMGKATAEKDDLPTVFDLPVDCDLHLEMMGSDVFVTGDSRTTIHPLCARCGEPFAREMKVDTSLTCRPEERKVPGTDSYQESEDGLVYFRRDELDLDEIIREQVLLALPMKYLCEENCRGLCASCGANLNLGPHACTVKTAVTK